MNIELTFINDADDMNNTKIVVFQKNNATNSENTAIAWTVIENCGRGWSHTFEYPMQYSVGAADSYGNLTNQETAQNGQKWELINSHTGTQLQLSDQPASRLKGVEIKNNLEQGSIDALIYRDGKLLASQRNLVPLQKYIFEDTPTLWIGAINGIIEGQTMNSSLLSEDFTELSLMGIRKANLVMTGGGIGPLAKPYQFVLEPTE